MNEIEPGLSLAFPCGPSMKIIPFCCFNSNSRHSSEGLSQQPLLIQELFRERDVDVKERRLEALRQVTRVNHPRNRLILGSLNLLTLSLTHAPLGIATITLPNFIHCARLTFT
jgi:hypothetical protein